MYMVVVGPRLVANGGPAAAAAVCTLEQLLTLDWRRKPSLETSPAQDFSNACKFTMSTTISRTRNFLPKNYA